MSQPSGVGTEIPKGVDPAPMAGAAASPDAAEKKYSEKDFAALRSAKDRELAAKEKDRLEALRLAEEARQAAAKADEQALEYWAKTAPPEQVVRVRQEREAYAKQQQVRDAEWAKFDAYRARIALREGLTEAEIDSVQTYDALAVLVAKKKAEQAAKVSEDTVRQKVLDELRAKGVPVDGPPAPKAPEAAAAAPRAGGKANEADLAKAKRAFEANPMDPKLRKAYEEAVESFAS